MSQEIVSLLGQSVNAAQQEFERRLGGQCWARFAEGFVPDHAGAVPPEADVLKVVQSILERCARAAQP
ncbi:hypothetical protein [Deinococcus sp.]|uniref:hypothetical protein n=1 Tax=Deinococcus sp. TaxID=47478 RepID=UPI003C7AFEA7